MSNDISKGFAAGYEDGFDGEQINPPDGMTEDWYEGYYDGWNEATDTSDFVDYE